MKIALIGAQGVGKTTLSQMINQEISSSVLIEEVVRNCPYEINEKTDFKTQWWVLSHGILAEQEAFEKKAPAIISDRCVVDSVVYARMIHQLHPERISAKQFQLIVDTAKNWIKTHPYQHVFFIRVSPNVWQNRDLDDGFRTTDINFYLNLEKAFLETLELLDVLGPNQLNVIYNDHSIEETYRTVINKLQN